jgi:hypothetical protein
VQSEKKRVHTLYVIRGLVNVKLYLGRDQVQQCKNNCIEMRRRGWSAIVNEWKVG